MVEAGRRNSQQGQWVWDVQMVLHAYKMLVRKCFLSFAFPNGLSGRVGDEVGQERNTLSGDRFSPWFKSPWKALL